MTDPLTAEELAKLRADPVGLSKVDPNGARSDWIIRLLATLDARDDGLRAALADAYREGHSEGIGCGHDLSPPCKHSGEQWVKDEAALGDWYHSPAADLIRAALSPTRTESAPDHDHHYDKRCEVCRYLAATPEPAGLDDWNVGCRFDPYYCRAHDSERASVMERKCRLASSGEPKP